MLVACPGSRIVERQPGLLLEDGVLQTAVTSFRSFSSTHYISIA